MASDPPARATDPLRLVLLGAVVGIPAALAVALFLAVVWFDASPTWAVAVGAAAGMAAETRLMVAPLLFSALLVGRAGLDTAPAAVLAATGAWLVTAALDRRTAPEPSAGPGPAGGPGPAAGAQ